MALLSELVKVISTVEGLDEVSVGIFARHAREAGLISQGGRGRSAATMTVRDATNLLIAVNGCTLAKEVPARVPLFRELGQIETEPSPEPGLGEPYSLFGDDLEKLLQLCGDPAWRSNLAPIPRSIMLEFGGPEPSARLSLYKLEDETGEDGDVIKVTAALHRRYRPTTDEESEQPDRVAPVLISSRTLIAVAEALQN